MGGTDDSVWGALMGGSGCADEGFSCSVGVFPTALMGHLDGTAAAHHRGKPT